MWDDASGGSADQRPSVNKGAFDPLKRSSVVDISPSQSVAAHGFVAFIAAAIRSAACAGVGGSHRRADTSITAASACSDASAEGKTESNASPTRTTPTGAASVVARKACTAHRISADSACTRAGCQHANAGSARRET